MNNTIAEIMVMCVGLFLVVLIVVAATRCETNRAKFKTECFEKVQKEECWKL